MYSATMGDWEDLCESFGLTAAAQWDEVEDRIFGTERRKSGRSVMSPTELSDADRPKGLPEEVGAAFQAAELAPPEVREVHQYAYRFALATGGGFDLWFQRNGRPTSFAMLHSSPAALCDVRVALQIHMRRPCAAERGCWSRTQERAMRDAFFEDRWYGIWVDHKPLKTQVVLRKTRYSDTATSPALDKTKRWGMAIIQHAEVGGSTVLARFGDQKLQRLLEDALTVFGLVDLPGAQRVGADVLPRHGI